MAADAFRRLRQHRETSRRPGPAATPSPPSRGGRVRFSATVSVAYVAAVVGHPAQAEPGPPVAGRPVRSRAVQRRPCRAAACAGPSRQRSRVVLPAPLRPHEGDHLAGADLQATPRAAPAPRRTRPTARQSRSIGRSPGRRSITRWSRADLLVRTLDQDPAGLQHGDPVGQAADDAHVVLDQHDGAALADPADQLDGAVDVLERPSRPSARRAAAPSGPARARGPAPAPASARTAGLPAGSSATSASPTRSSSSSASRPVPAAAAGRDRQNRQPSPPPLCSASSTCSRSGQLRRTGW